MSMQDNISDFLNQIKLAQYSKKKNIIIEYSKVKYTISNIFYKFGYINNFYFIILNKIIFIKIYLKYFNKEGVITNIKRISKPSLRKYLKFKELNNINFKLGITIISTSYGIMSHIEALKKKKGGEIICIIY